MNSAQIDYISTYCTFLTFFHHSQTDNSDNTPQYLIQVKWHIYKGKYICSDLYWYIPSLKKKNWTMLIKMHFWSTLRNWVRFYIHRISPLYNLRIWAYSMYGRQCVQRQAEGQATIFQIKSYLTVTTIGSFLGKHKQYRGFVKKHIHSRWHPKHHFKPKCLQYCRLFAFEVAFTPHGAIKLPG